MTEGTVLVDTNVLAYAYQSFDDRHETAVNVLDELIENGRGAVSVQNLAEFSRLAVEKFPKTISHEEAREIVLNLSASLDVVSYRAQTVSEALRLCRTYKLHFFDALLAATMEQDGIRIIVTENEKDFRKIPWLKVVNPFKP
jgi:predicted nucleic acid-binding protein